MLFTLPRNSFRSRLESRMIFALRFSSSISAFVRVSTGSRTSPRSAASNSAKMASSLARSSSVLIFASGILLLLARNFLVLFKNAIFDILAQLAGNGLRDTAQVFALEERVHGITHEQAVFAIHHAEPADQDLVIQDDVCDPLHFPHERIFLERVDLHVGDCQAVKVDTRFFLFRHCR